MIKRKLIILAASKRLESAVVAKLIKLYVDSVCDSVNSNL